MLEFSLKDQIIDSIPDNLSRNSISNAWWEDVKSAEKSP